MKAIFKTMIFSIVALTLLTVLIIRNDIQNEAVYKEKQRASEQNNKILNSDLYQEVSTENINVEEASNEIDRNLMESGIIDKNYRYTESNKKDVFFKAMTTNLRKELPSPPDEYGVITKDFELTPYQITQTFIINTEVSIEEAELMQANVQTEDFYKVQCATMFGASYQRANNTRVEQRMYDLKNKLILETTLDKSKCPKVQLK